MARWRGPAGAAKVALTFDDGPDPDWTPPILDLLDTYGLTATFFCLGEQAVRHPALTRKIRHRGHEIGAPGFRHGHHLLRTAAAVRHDLDQAVSVLRGVTGEPVRFFRPPFGQVSVGTIAAARHLGLELVLWSAWGREWAGRQPASVARRIERRLRPGAIVLLHDSDHVAPAGTAAVTASIIGQLAAALEARQLRAVTLTGLLSP